MKLGPEDKIQLAILDYLEMVLPYAKVWHTPNGGRRSLSEGVRFKALGVVAGAPDINLVVDGKYYGIEVKAPKGRVSDAQNLFGEDLRVAGAQYAVVYSVDDVRLALNAWNIKTREAA